MSSAENEPNDPRARLLAWLAPAGAELWTRVAILVLVLFACGVLVLGMRPGGALPIWLYARGRTWIALLALAVLVWGVVHSARRRPFVRPARMRAWFALTLVIGVANAAVPYPSAHLGHPSLVPFRLPIEGQWTVLWGGERGAENRLALFHPDRRWGMHLVRVVDGSAWAGDGTRAEDHHAFGQPVLAPAAGRVVAVRDGDPDHAPGRPERAAEPFGNHVVIEVSEGQFLFLTGLQQGSVRVATGDAVEVGEPLGRVGSSGFSPLSPAPHLALHLADRPQPRRGEAIPWTFRDYLADGRLVEVGLPRGGLGAGGTFTGQQVQNAP